MFFQPLSAENGTFFQPDVEFIYKISAFKVRDSETTIRRCRETRAVARAHAGTHAN